MSIKRSGKSPQKFVEITPVGTDCNAGGFIKCCSSPKHDPPSIVGL